MHKNAQHLYIDDVNVDASIDTAARTTYTASMQYREGDRLYPIRGKGSMDAQARTNLQRWTAAHVPLPRLVNYGVNNAAIDMRSGSLKRRPALLRKTRGKCICKRRESCQSTQSHSRLRTVTADSTFSKAV